MHFQPRHQLGSHVQLLQHQHRPQQLSLTNGNPQVCVLSVDALLAHLADKWVMVLQRHLVVGVRGVEEVMPQCDHKIQLGSRCVVSVAVRLGKNSFSPHPDHVFGWSCAQHFPLFKDCCRPYDAIAIQCRGRRM